MGSWNICGAKDIEKIHMSPGKNNKNKANDDAAFYAGIMNRQSITKELTSITGELNN